ncbi:DUF3052 family protein [Embleya scabrispora]|uniref:DUF3052 family protein n=1 Tax=Embleya scabrispora TaxID=159449 RepID=UPI000478119C|nr:DUF3052 family protein [Embleya scabrispora]MYS80274.1 DUF3052 family protein [Streptomyces sp. SID5474]
MTSTTDTSDLAARLGLKQGLVVQEFGHDGDDDLHAAIERITGKDLVGEDHDDVVDVALLWFRDGDGDLAEARGMLADEGAVWVLTPKAGLGEHVDPGDIEATATTFGLTRTTTVGTASDWAATRLIAAGTTEARD